MPIDLDTLCAERRATAKAARCNGCMNKCALTVFSFPDGRRYYIGNKCERVFSNRGEKRRRGANLFTERNALLFYRPGEAVPPAQGLRIGVPRILEMFETYPFWNALLTRCGLSVLLSPPSSQAGYEKVLGTVMSDNICFPAKLAHSHAAALVAAGADRIFYPHVVYTASEDETAVNSYDCPIVSAYGEVLRGALGLGRNGAPPLDSPVISFRDEKLLREACGEYLASLGVPRERFAAAFAAAGRAQAEYRAAVVERGQKLLTRARTEGRPLIVLAGRPYHSDPLIEHQTSEILADLGVDVLPADAVAPLAAPNWNELAVVSQWTYPNRLLKAAQWAAAQPEPSLQYVMLTSFGCGPDAFIMDEIRGVLAAAGKIFTLIKVDDISSVGSIRLRLRSLVETLRWRPAGGAAKRPALPRTPPYTMADRKKPIIAPYFADCYTPFIAPGLKAFGYDVRILPPPDAQSVEYGLQYTNNEVCYPAIIVVGDIIKAFKSGAYDPENTAVAMSQTGGQCRATSYITLVKRALVAAGYTHVPVVAFAGRSLHINDQPGFKLSGARLVWRGAHVLFYADAIARMYYRAAVRERRTGEARAVRDRFLKAGADRVEANRIAALPQLLAEAVAAFNAALGDADPRPRIAIVGEIYMKYNAFSQLHITDWMMEQNVEVCVPSLLDFFLQFFVNNVNKRETHLVRKSPRALLERPAERLIRRWGRPFEAVLRGFRLYEPQIDVHRKAELAAEILDLSNQYGEGWLIPAEIAALAGQGVNDVVCVQPFGCIANHIVAKGIERTLKERYPLLNLLFLDFDAGTSEVNFLNRLHYMIDNLKAETEKTDAGASA